MVGQLNDKEKLVILKQLREETWQKRFGAAVKTMRRVAQKHPLSEEEIRRECEAVRQERYEREVRSGRR